MPHAPRLVLDLLSLSDATLAMDATSDRCALVDDAGRILQTNRAWDRAPRNGDPAPLATVEVGTDLLGACGNSARLGNRDAGSLHAQLKSVIEGRTDRAQIGFERALRSGGSARTLATIERIDAEEDRACVLLSFSSTDGAVATPTSIPEVEFSLPSGSRFDRLRLSLDSLPCHAAILDERSRIVATNVAWRAFSEAAGGNESTTGLGNSYLSVCERAADSGDVRAASFASGLRSVLRGDRHTFYTDSHVGHGSAIAKFRGRVTNVSLAEGRYVLVTHTEMKRTATVPKTLSTAA